MEMLLNTNEQGRIHMQDLLKTYLLDLELIHAPLPSDSHSHPSSFNDVYPFVSNEELAKQKSAQSSEQTPIIRHTDDLVSVIIRILRRLITDDNSLYSTFVIQTISEVKEPLTPADEDHNESDLISQVDRIKRDL